MNKPLADAIADLLSLIRGSQYGLQFGDGSLRQGRRLHQEEMTLIVDALAAARAQVPREPTEAMMQAAYEDWNTHNGSGKPRSAAEGMRARWRAMYDASPINALHETED